MEVVGEEKLSYSTQIRNCEEGSMFTKLPEQCTKCFSGYSNQMLLKLLVANVTKGVVLRHWIAFAIVYFGIDDFLELILVVAGVTACAGIARVCGRARWQVGLIG